MEAKVYNQKGESNSVTVPENIFGLPWNGDLVHQVVVSMQSSARNPIAHTKTRGEVRGGGKKPWQQKGTGRARHGSSRSPIWVGGGVTHGPRNDKNYDRKVNKKMKAKALFTILSRKYREGEIFFIDSLSLSGIKTKDAVASLEKFGKISGFPTLAKRKNAFYLALPERNELVQKSLRNLSNITVQEARNINPVSALQYKAIIFVNPEEALKAFEGKMGKVKVAGEAEGVKAPRRKAKTVKAKAPAKKKSAKVKRA
jgi:large subunit ribosomal protein L4